MPGAVQMSDNVGIHEKETLDEEEQEKQAVKAKVEKAIGESFDDDDWEYVDASECHVGSLDRGSKAEKGILHRQRNRLQRC